VGQAPKAAILARAGAAAPRYDSRPNRASESTMTQPPNPPGPTPQPGSDDPSRWQRRDTFRDRYQWGGARDTGAIVWGLILLAIGVWFFLGTTLGISLPHINWSDAWPIILIVIGAIVIAQGLRRRSG
jgi:uncharacterized integral membrane protein